MLNIGWSELLLVAIVAIVVVGPKDLPRLMRTFGVYAGKLRRAAADFQRQFDEAMAESEADEVRKNIEAIRSNMGTTADFATPPNTPLMTPTTPAPQSIEQAIAPKSRKTVKRRTRTKKAPAKKAAAKKVQRKTPKRKTVQRKTASPKRKKAAKKSTARTRRRR